MTIINISGYKFVELDKLATRQALLKHQCSTRGIRGTILLGVEGINLMLAGTREAIDAFKAYLARDSRFGNIPYKESTSDKIPFQRIRVRIKDEIIAMHMDEVQPQQKMGKRIAPNELKAWLDEGRDFTLLDTRNDYEIDFGTFDKAIDFDIETFKQFPEAAKALKEGTKQKPLVMFCTGGIRCEKASVALMEDGFQDVYQLDGGILKYFEECGGAHYQGDCFVFDERVALKPDLTISGIEQCRRCQGPITFDKRSHPSYQTDHYCQECDNEAN